MPLPSLGHAPRDSFSLVDRVIYGERDGFQEPFRLPLEDVPPQQLGGVFYQVDENVTVEPAEIAIKIELRWTKGAPRRMHHVGLFTIQPGTWARLRYNYRAAIEETWLSVQRTLNIAAGTDFDPKLFTTTDPVNDYEDIAHLW